MLNRHAQFLPASTVYQHDRSPARPFTSTTVHQHDRSREGTHQGAPGHNVFAQSPEHDRSRARQPFTGTTHPPKKVCRDHARPTDYSVIVLQIIMNRVWFQ
jgi:hypothetical protein